MPSIYQTYRAALIRVKALIFITKRKEIKKAKRRGRIRDYSVTFPTTPDEIANSLTNFRIKRRNDDNTELIDDFIDSNREDIIRAAKGQIELFQEAIDFVHKEKPMLPRQFQTQLHLHPDLRISFFIFTGYYEEKGLVRTGVISVWTKEHFEQMIHIRHSQFGKGKIQLIPRRFVDLDLSLCQPVSIENPEFDTTVKWRSFEPKIRRVVRALNILGIKTTLSCQGHLNKTESWTYRGDPATRQEYFYKKVLPHIYINIFCFGKLMSLIGEFENNKKFVFVLLSNNMIKFTTSKYMRLDKAQELMEEFGVFLESKIASLSNQS
jgi:hypothetical protein